MPIMASVKLSLREGIEETGEIRQWMDETGLIIDAMMDERLIRLRVYGNCGMLLSDVGWSFLVDEVEEHT